MQQRTFEQLVNEFIPEAEASEEAFIRQVSTFVEALQAQAGGPRGYRLRRIILTNFWLYGRQEFEIPHGRLFLAGENASGKSTVLTAAVPLALDGDLRPNRLDTFGGRERRIEYYVLGSNDSATPFSHERRTSYIALEFEWCDPDLPPIAQELRQRWENGDREGTRFLTIGLSIAGNVNVTDRIRPLRFLITDGSRLGYELDTVYETGNKHEQRAYDQTRFKQLLEGHGVLCETQAEYERQVARYLFGLSDGRDYEKLIDLLLILRRPNLSTELSFSRVHDYLKMSLRKISSETTSRVIGTIERIDAIQSEIERIQQAYDATERVHRARQHLALVRAQLTACEYVGAHFAEDTIQSRVTKLRKDMTRAENERREAEGRIQTFQAEYYQVNGQIKALEASEGLQVATQLAGARERTREAETQFHQVEQNLETTRHTLTFTTENVQRQQDHFARSQAENLAHLQALRAIASEEALWETAAYQLQEACQPLAALSTHDSSAPQLPSGLPALLEEQADERAAWLHQLEDLHRQREQVEQSVHYARDLEATRFQELDDARRRFQELTNRAYEAQQQLAQALMLFAADENLLFADELSPTEALDEDESHMGRILEQFVAILNRSREIIEGIEMRLVEAIDLTRSEMDELHLLTGRKMGEIEEIKALYEQKQAEPEFSPPRSPRRVLARTRLSENGIAALPLYALLDFVPDLSEQEAGRIEYALEDAGLLDALVVAPSERTAAQTLLAAEGLSDGLLNLEVMGQFQGYHQHCLRFDAALLQTLETSDTTDWEMITKAILHAPAQSTGSAQQSGYSMSEDGTWTHGLLTGQASPGPACCIGRATRLRVRQNELDELERRRGEREAELQELTSRLAQYEQSLLQVQEQQTQLRKALPASGLEDACAGLAPSRGAVEAARTKYQKARQQTQEARQQYHTLIARIERESQGNAALASDPRRVQSALLGVVKFKNQVRSLHQQFGTIITLWDECQKAREALERARASETTVLSLYERIRQQALQARAEMDELQRVASLSDLDELSERLRALRERNDVLLNDLDEVKQKRTRADERAKNLADAFTEAEALLAEAQRERTQKQEHFVDQLAAYPTEELVAAQQVDIMDAAGQILGGSLLEQDVSVRKEMLEATVREAYNAIARTFNREQSILLEYGPDLDDQGQVLFLSEQRSRPIDLLQILSERIEMQKTLLGEEERQLFETFLLQEIAEAIRTHILEAEEWVQQINGVLSNLPMIGEHYALQWKAPAEYDLAKLGGHLAQHHRLLRKPGQALTDEETETLMNAFRREIEAVRLRQQETPDMNFMEALERVFDYREWFHFDVWVTPTGGQRQRLTDRVAGTRSGAEQLFALYVPLFAALGAVYRSAAPGAPRLLALDEAFDKVSSANTQRILEFLISQDFQWIMTGPQVDGTGSKIPASARYLMIHEKGSTVATASASFWSDNPQGVEN